MGLNEAIRTSSQEALLSSLIPLLPTWLFSNMVDDGRGGGRCGDD